VASETATAALEGCVPPPPSLAPPIIPCLPEPLGIVEEEDQWTYEFGVKASWLDGRLSTNLAAYHIDWQKQGLFTTVSLLQAAGTRTTTTIIRNVGESRVDGLELESTLNVNDRLSLLASYGYTDSRFVEGVDPVLTELTGDGDLHDKRVPGIPRHTLILGAVATVPVGPAANAFLNVDYAHSSKRYAAANNFGWIGDDTTVNLRAGVELESWTVTGYVRNLTDDDTPVASLDFVNFGPVDVNYRVNSAGNLLNGLDPRMFSLNPKRGRDVGLEVQYRF
jgi:iron complex outermembrane receptor protein